MINKYKFKRELTTTLMWYGLIQLVLGMTRLEPIPFVVLGIVLLMAWMDN